MQSKDKNIQAIIDLFINREDTYGQQNNEKYIRIPKPLTEENIKEHLLHKKTISIYQLNQQNKVKWICFDFDNKENPEKTLPEAKKLLERLQKTGKINYLLEFSGRKGHHVWVFTEPIDAYSAQYWAKEISTGIIVSEIFPKQTIIKENEYGNSVKLPLGLHQFNQKESTIFNEKQEPLNQLQAIEYLEKKSNEPKTIIPHFEKTEEKKQPEQPKRKKNLSANIKALVLNGSKEGERHKNTFIIIKEMYWAGYEQKQIESAVLFHNKKSNPPQEETEILRQIKDLLSNPQKYLKQDEKFIQELLEDPPVKSNKKKPNEISFPLAQKILEKFHVKTLADTKEIFYFDEQTGLYCPAEIMFETIAQQQLGLDGSTYIVNEVLNHIRRQTYFDREKQSNLELIPLENGLYNFKTKKLEEYQPQYFFTDKHPVFFEPNAQCPKINQFLKEVMQEDEKQVKKLKQIAAYVFYREYAIQKAFMLLGSGSNGKSVYLNLVREMLGPLRVSSVALQSLNEDRFSASRLYGKNANIFADLESKALKSVSVFKSLTGEDWLTCDRKFKDAFDFKNHAKLLFSCNRLPESDDDSDAFYRRWVIVDFLRQFSEKEQNKRLLAELTTPEEKSGFFNELMEELEELLVEQRFGEETIDEIREKYSKNANSAKFFCYERLELDSNGFETREALMAAYLSFCSQTKVPSLNEKALFDSIRKFFEGSVLDRKRRMDDDLKRGFFGLRIKKGL